MDIPNKLAVHIDEAVDISGVGRTSLYDAIRDGRLEVRKAGRRSLILIDDLRAFLLTLPKKETGPPSPTDSAA